MTEAHSTVFYIEVPRGNVQEFMSRLDLVKGADPNTLHYSLPIEPVIESHPNVLFMIDERAESVLTPEEWDSRLATMPVEFVRPLSTP